MRGGENILKFVILGNLTQQGIKTIKDAGKRQKQAVKIMEQFGCKLLNLYYTMGKYDWIAVVEGPDIEAAMKALFVFGVGLPSLIFERPSWLRRIRERNSKFYWIR